MSAAVLPADPYALPRCGYGILADAFAPVDRKPEQRVAKHFRLGIHVATAIAGIPVTIRPDGSMVCRRFPREVRS